VPGTPVQWAAFSLSLLFAWLVSFAWRFLFNLSAFWVPNAQGIGRLAFTVAFFMCGFVYPLRFFPDWFVRICHFTPFPSLVNTPVEIYLGLRTGAGAAGLLLTQLLWFLALAAAGRLVLRAGVRRLVILGG
jgi:ABC-2 type transport system permease protein